MTGSQSNENDLIFSLYNDSRTVYRLNDIAMLLGCWIRKQRNKIDVLKLNTEQNRIELVN